MESRMVYSFSVYLMVEQIDGNDFDYWKFDTLVDALDWLKNYPTHTHNWTLSTEPVGLPATEYTNWEDGLIHPELTKNSSFNKEK